MFLRVVFSILLITVLTAEGSSLPPNLYNYIDWAYGVNTSDTEISKTVDSNAVRSSSAFLSNSFAKVTVSAKIKKLTGFNPVCFNEDGFSSEYNINNSAGFISLDISIAEEPFLYFSDNSPPMFL